MSILDVFHLNTSITNNKHDIRSNFHNTTKNIQEQNLRRNEQRKKECIRQSDQWYDYGRRRTWNKWMEQQRNHREGRGLQWPGTSCLQWKHSYWIASRGSEPWWQHRGTSNSQRQRWTANKQECSSQKSIVDASYPPIPSSKLITNTSFSLTTNKTI